MPTDYEISDITTITLYNRETGEVVFTGSLADLKLEEITFSEEKEKTE